MKIIDLFAGIGGIRLGFERYGCECVFTSEWDDDAQRMYQANFGHLPHGDITQIAPEAIPDHDILLGGFPCQPFSIIGKSLGFADTRGTLFFNVEEILRVKRPYAVLLENVKRLQSHDSGQTLKVIVDRLESLGYSVHTKVLNALHYGVPQKRERIFIVGFQEDIKFSFPKPTGQHKGLSEILEPDEFVDSSLFASESIRKSRIEKVKGNPVYPSIWHENKERNVSALPYSCALRAGASYNYLLVNGQRRLSPREMLRLQGFPEDFKIEVSYQAMRRLAGNSVAVPVIEAVASQMLKAMTERKILSVATQLTLAEC